MQIASIVIKSFKYYNREYYSKDKMGKKNFRISNYIIGGEGYKSYN